MGRDLEKLVGKISTGDDEWQVVCFDHQHPHPMPFPIKLQAEALASVLTRDQTPCPVCGCVYWSAVGGFDFEPGMAEANAIMSEGEL